MTTRKKAPKIIQVTITHDGHIAAVLYDDGHVFVRIYTSEAYGNPAAEGYWSELQYPDLKVAKKT